MSVWKPFLALTALGIGALAVVAEARNPSAPAERKSLVASARVETNDGTLLGEGSCWTEMGETCEVEVIGEAGAGIVARLRPVREGEEIALDLNLVVRDLPQPECAEAAGGCGATLRAAIATKPTFGPFGWVRVAEASGPYRVAVTIHGLSTADAHRGATQGVRFVGP